MCFVLNTSFCIGIGFEAFEDPKNCFSIDQKVFIFFLQHLFAICHVVDLKIRFRKIIGNKFYSKKGFKTRKLSLFFDFCHLEELNFKSKAQTLHCEVFPKLANFFIKPSKSNETS